MTTVVQVTRRERAAARLLRELDKLDGRKSDPRVEAIANAQIVPGTDTAMATVGEPAIGGQAVGSNGPLNP